MRPGRFAETIRPAASAAGLLAALVTFTACDDAGLPREGTATLEEPPAGLHTVEISDGLVTLQATNAPLESIVSEIARKSELSVACGLVSEARVTVALERVRLSDALRRILGERSFILYRAPAKAGTQRPGVRTADTLCVFSDDATHAIAPVRVSSYTLHAIENLQSSLMSDDRHARRRAVRALRRLAASEAVPALSYALADPDESIRVEAIYAIAAIGGGDAVAALAAASADRSARVRSEAAAALGTLGGDAAIQVLQRALRDADNSVRAAAISALGLIGEEQAAAALAVALADTDSALRMDAIAALAEIGGESSVALLDRASRHVDPNVRNAAADALADLKDQHR